MDRDEMLDALLRADFDLVTFHTQSAAATREIDEGDVTDLGDRLFEGLHLPGHTPCSIGLWELATRILFAGDSIYDGPLVDFLAESDINAYTRNDEATPPAPGRDGARRL